jgi:hypothetical protein
MALFDRLRDSPGANPDPKPSSTWSALDSKRRPMSAHPNFQVQSPFELRQLPVHLLPVIGGITISAEIRNVEQENVKIQNADITYITYM